MPKDARVHYDIEFDILYIATGTKVNDSLEFEPYVIDFSIDGKIVGFSIMNASKYFKDIFDEEIDKEKLMKIKEAKFSIIQYKDFASIRILMNIPLAKKMLKNQVFTATAPVAAISC
ncbi:MAG: DUF2283 domain-containing protein [archaeon]